MHILRYFLESHQNEWSENPKYLDLKFQHELNLLTSKINVNFKDTPRDLIIGGVNYWGFSQKVILVILRMSQKYIIMT